MALSKHADHLHNYDSLILWQTMCFIHKRNKRVKYYNVYINHDPVMTLTQFMARSTWVDYAFKWGKLLKCHLKGKASRKLANGQNIDYSEKKKKMAQGLYLPLHWG